MLIHPEILAALAMAIPGIFSIYYLIIVQNVGTKISATACLIHLPWSAGLHFYRAYGSDPLIRTYLYKADVSFQHIYSLLTRYAFIQEMHLIETIFHILCITHILFCNPIQNPQIKKYISILSGIGLGSCTLALSHERFYISFGVASIGFFIHYKEIIGPYSPFWFHLCLSVPHYCILSELNQALISNLEQ
jgi:hypothetical protein